MKFKNKYRSSSIRIKDYDYGQNGVYFITICTKNRYCFFGHIVKDEMQFSAIGTIANHVWEEIPKQFQYVRLGEWVIMPNHMHGIVMIEKPYKNTIHLRRDKSRLYTNKQQNHINKRRNVTCATGSIYPVIRGGVTNNCNPMLQQNLSHIIRWYKGRTTYEIRKIQPSFSWQSRFYEHVVRNESDFSQVSEYIINNPLKWALDEYHI